MIIKLPTIYRGSYIANIALNELNFMYEYEGKEKRWVTEKIPSFYVNKAGVLCSYDINKYFVVRIHHEILEKKKFGKYRFKVDILKPVYTIDLSTSVLDEGESKPTDLRDIYCESIVIYAQYLNSVERFNFPVNAPFPGILKEKLFSALRKISEERVDNANKYSRVMEERYADDPDKKVINIKSLLHN